MKRLIVILLAMVLSVSTIGQAPEKMSYQAVVRDGTNNVVKSSAVGVRISILQGTASGTPVYVETQTPISNSNGLVSMEIGAGNRVSGSFPSINWAAGPYFIKTETDPNGGTNYTVAGTSQLLSVPYALHAKTAEKFISTNSTLLNLTYPDGFNDITPITQRFGSAGYTVPAGKTLYITNIYSEHQWASFQINNLSIATGKFNLNTSTTSPNLVINNPIIVGEGQVISVSPNAATINGYLK